MQHELLLGEQVVMDMTEPFVGKRHHIFFDNFFTSMRLIGMLEDRDLYACGTIRTNRKGWPDELRKPASLKLKPGDCIQLQKGKVTATLWHDKRDVVMVSNNCNPLGRTERIRRKKGGGTTTVPCPSPVVVYNKGMGGVDLADQHRSYYPVGRKSNKWWKYVLYFMINVSIINAFILYSNTTVPETQVRVKNQLQFREQLVKQLIGDFTSRRRLENPKSKIPFAHAVHQLTPTTLRNCVICAREGRKTNGKNPIRSSWECLGCRMVMCKTPCFIKVHQTEDKEVYT